MPVEVFEKFESRRSTKANQVSQSSAELGYIVRGTDNDIAVQLRVIPAMEFSASRCLGRLHNVFPRMCDVYGWSQEICSFASCGTWGSSVPV